MKELIEQVIQMGNYDLTQLLDTIDRYHIEGRLSDDERMELYMTARKGAEPDYDYKGEIDALWAAIRELQKTVAPPSLTRNGPNSSNPPVRERPTRWATRSPSRGEAVCLHSGSLRVSPRGLSRRMEETIGHNLSAACESGFVLSMYGNGE